MLYSFKPTHGPKAGSNTTYYFPRTTVPDERGGTIDPNGGEIELVEGQNGGYVSTGSGPMHVGPAEFTITFEISSNWLRHNDNNGGKGYSDSLDGREDAIDDFIMYVLMGGMGTIVDKSGTKTKTGQAWAHSQYAIRRLGVTRAEIQATLTMPSGFWKRSDGTYIYAG